ncbi:hypothetical protein WHJ95_12755, partial [Staphylococcus aureus]|uniref:hypothetical protein n=1 Tax=Staphylococcus aureus TaxID=1280 RepID=UPI0039BE3264
VLAQIHRPPISSLMRSSAASDVKKRHQLEIVKILELSGIISSFSLKKNKNNSPEINNKVLKSKNNLNFFILPLSRE